MGYFGGLGAGKGWLRFLFLVDPEVLRSVLMKIKPVLVITNARVPAEYVETQLNQYIAAYSQYLDAMLVSAEVARRASMGIYMGLAASLEQFSPKLCTDVRYKLMNPDEPVVNLSPLTLHYDARKGHLGTNTMSNLYFGVELSFPRVISLDRDKHEILYETREFKTNRIFENLESELQKATNPCKIRSQSREHRTPIRITTELQERMKRHPGLIAAHLDIL